MIRATALVSVLLLCAAPVHAQSVQESIVRQLTEQGFSEVRISRTWLGRSRIVARSDDLYREIIVNPATGEILRDYWRQNDGSSGNRSEILDVGRDRDETTNRSGFDGDDADEGDGGDNGDGGWGSGDDRDSDGDGGWGGNDSDSDSDSDGGDSDGGDSDGGDSDGGDGDGGGNDD